MNILDLAGYILYAFIENILYYSVFAGLFFLIFWVVWKKYWQPRRIQQKESATSKHFRHDIVYSSLTFVISAILIGIIYYLEHLGLTAVYWDVADFGWGWPFLSFFIVLFLDDTFFYWAHRLMHHPRLYRAFQKVHHNSKDPSPLTAFAFSPLEAIVENMIYVILPLIIPLHVSVVLAWVLFSMLNNVLAHLGYELYPKNWIKIPFLKYKTTSTHHNMHHERFTGNYALYFTWWDQWMGTQFKDYEQKHQAVFKEKEEG